MESQEEKHTSRIDCCLFFRAEYCRNNFNDYLSSLILLFELTVVNQWHGKTHLFLVGNSTRSCLSFGFGFCSCDEQMGTIVLHCLSSLCSNRRSEVQIDLFHQIFL